MPESPSLDVRRLAEVDRRLRLIQVGLEPFSGPAERTAEPFSGPADRTADAGGAPTPFAADASPEIRIDALSAAHDALRARVGRLEASVAELAAPGRPTRPAAPTPPTPPAPPSASDAVTVAAGPFADTVALRSFERALSSLPEVRAVSVREFHGAHRVVVEVRLGAPTS